MSQPTLQRLRRSLARRLQEKAELEAQVRAVESRLQEELAPLQEEVLRLQMEHLKAAAQSRRRSASLRNAYHDAQDAYDEFRARQDRASEFQKDSSGSLKGTYRRATKRCHPDAVPDSYHEEAAATFQALESAYDAEHEGAVRAIADALDTWGFPSPPSAGDSSGSETEAELRRAVSDLDTSIEHLRDSTAFRVVTETDEADVAAIVGAQKRALQQRLVQLKRRRRARF